MPPPTEDTAELLSRIPVFAELGADDLGRVAQVAVPRSFDGPEVIFREGDDSDTVICIFLTFLLPHLPRPRFRCLYRARAIRLATSRRSPIAPPRRDGSASSAPIAASAPTSLRALRARVLFGIARNAALDELRAASAAPPYR